MFRLLGFDVRVRTGFVLFIVLIVFIHQDTLGLWLAAAIAGFTLLHELGHAVAARIAGAQASISLDFMAGYTSFTTTRPLSKRERALISVSGPATQIVTSVAVLLAMGVDPLSLDSVRESDPSLAIWWAGPVIGLLNLVPVLPLDGGHIAQTALEVALRRPAPREMAIASLVVTIGIAAIMAVTGQTDLVIFVAFLLLGQWQILRATAPASGPAPASGVWANDGFMQPVAASPWQLAYQAIAAGQPQRAERIIIDDLVTDAGDGSGERRWPAPTDAPIDVLRAIVESLPRDLPAGNAYSHRVLAEILFAVGHQREAGEFAAQGFSRHRSPLLALVVARAAAHMGDHANALQWVHAATAACAHRAPKEHELVARMLDIAPELDMVRADPSYASSRAGLR